MPKLTVRSVEACCIICIIVLLERKVKGGLQERLRENHRKVLGIGILSAPVFSLFLYLLGHAVISNNS